eukprot:IDg16847t1
MPYTARNTSSYTALTDAKRGRRCGSARSQRAVLERGIRGSRALAETRRLIFEGPLEMADVITAHKRTH